MSLSNLMRELERELSETPLLMVETKDPRIGKWGMSKLWRAWMATTAEWMAARGATMPLTISADGKLYGSRPFNADDAHELFTHQWLGVDSDGNRLSWSRGGHDDMRAATKAERYHAMCQHEQWSLERGILLLQPRDSEYAELQQEAAA